MIDYITKDIEELTYDFFIATGVNLQILDDSFNRLNYSSYTFSKKYCQIIQSSKAGRHLCAESDKKILNQCKETKEATFHICPAGLIDLAVPIINEDTIIGYILLGQIKHKNELALNETFFEKTAVDASLLKKECGNQEYYQFGDHSCKIFSHGKNYKTKASSRITNRYWFYWRKSWKKLDNFIYWKTNLYLKKLIIYLISRKF